jgi:hypothetical protein
LKERRKEKGLSERERKEMREGMWEVEEEGGGDVVTSLHHNLYDDVRRYSRSIVVMWGYGVEEKH